MRTPVPPATPASDRRIIIVLTMSISGGLAGLGGSVEILGVTKNYPAEYIVAFGFDGIAVALLGRAHPAGVVGCALLFGVMRAGPGRCSGRPASRSTSS